MEKHKGIRALFSLFLLYSTMSSMPHSLFVAQVVGVGWGMASHTLIERSGAGISFMGKVLHRLLLAL